MTPDGTLTPGLRERLVELFGPDGALELMERVPQVPWHELATKTDLACLVTSNELDLRLDALEHRLRSDIFELRTEMTEKLSAFGLRLTTTMVSTMLAGIFGAAGLAFAAARIG